MVEALCFFGLFVLACLSGHVFQEWLNMDREPFGHEPTPILLGFILAGPGRSVVVRVPREHVERVACQLDIEGPWA